MHPHVAGLHHWGYKTVPQDHGKPAMPNIIGGTTSVNEMVYNQGNKHTWAYEEDKEWCAALPENAHLPKFDRKFHSSGGPQSVEDNDLLHNATRQFLAAGKEQLGFSSLQLMTLRGEWKSVFASFIENVHRKNMYVLKGNVMVEVLISPQTKSAPGVKNTDPSGKATKEVSSSAGALNSAQLLGSKEALHKIVHILLIIISYAIVY